MFPASVMHLHSFPGSACARKRRSAAGKCSSPRADGSEVGLPLHFIWRHGRCTTPRTTWESSSVGSAASSGNRRRLPLQLISSLESSTTCSARERHMTNPCSQMRRGGVEACRDAAPQAGRSSWIQNHSGRGRLIVPWFVFGIVFLGVSRRRPQIVIRLVEVAHGT